MDFIYPASPLIFLLSALLHEAHAQPPQPPPQSPMQSPPSPQGQDFRLVSAVVFTVGLFLALPFMILTLRWAMGLERSEGHEFSPSEEVQMFFKWSLIIILTLVVVFVLPYLLPLNIGVYIVAGIGGTALIYLFISYTTKTEPEQTRSEPRRRLTVEERNQIVRERIREIATINHQRRQAANRHGGNEKEIRGVPPEVIASFAFRTWASQRDPSPFDPSSSVDENDTGSASTRSEVNPPPKMAKNRPTELKIEEAALPGSIPSLTPAGAQRSDDKSFFLANPAFKDRASSRILSVMSRPVTLSFSRFSLRSKKITPAQVAMDDGPSCPICLEEFREGEEVCAMPCHGKHDFHRACIGEWMKDHRNCPVCRGELWDGVTRVAAGD